MNDILQLVRKGKLGEATARILSSLRRERAASAPTETATDAANDSAIDSVARRVDETDAAPVERVGVTKKAGPAAASPATRAAGPADAVAPVESEAKAPETRPAIAPSKPAERPRTGKVETRSFASPIGAMSYRIYVPAPLPGEAPPLLLMLHGCTQNPDDFARGTRMDELAGAEGYVVVYPAQTAARNLNKCWNWFDPSNQALVVGEAAALAALTEAVASEHGVDRRRIFVAGLSAGGAMAVNLGALYPQLFAGVGAHSGLPFGSARDIPSAFAAMQRGGTSRVDALAPGDGVPTIAFYGDADRTVNPVNGRAIVADLLHAAGDMTGTAGVAQTNAAGGESAVRHVYHRKDGRILAEEWRVPDGGHAWYGGDKGGTFTQPAATDASAHMLAFFRAVAAQPEPPAAH